MLYCDSEITIACPVVKRPLEVSRVARLKDVKVYGGRGSESFVARNSTRARRLGVVVFQSESDIRFLVLVVGRSHQEVVSQTGRLEGSGWKEGWSALGYVRLGAA